MQRSSLTCLTHGLSLMMVFLKIAPVLAYDNGLAITPPMGWNSWNHFHCNTTLLTQDLVKETARAMVDSGMKAAGYQYINIDDCVVNKTRGANGKLQADPRRFPDGFPALAEYIHSLGLKFGVYSDTSRKTCAGYPGIQDYADVDAQTFKEWGVDYVKMDGCYTNVTFMPAIYRNFSKLLNETGRPMVFSCSWPTYANSGYLDKYKRPYPVSYEDVASVCNLWRYYKDVIDTWASWTAVLDYQENATLSQYAGPGQWNDPDMLFIGNGNQTDAEYRSLFSLWSIIAAPLIAGNDLRNMTPATIEILTAPEVIAIDQDILGIQGKRVVKNGDLEVWARPLFDGSIAVALFNRGVAHALITANWTDVGLNENQTIIVRDVWYRSDLGQHTRAYSAVVASHATVLVKLTNPCIQDCLICKDDVHSCELCAPSKPYFYNSVYGGQCLLECPYNTTKQSTTCVDLIENLEDLISDSETHVGEITGVYSLFGLGMIVLVLLIAIYWMKRQQFRS